MSAGISGANFWIPVYLFLIKMDPLICFWLALITMIFGFGSGMIRNIYQGTVNWYMVKQYLIATGLGKLITPGMWNHERIKCPSHVIGSTVYIGTYKLDKTPTKTLEIRDDGLIEDNGDRWVRVTQK